jgi:hypothetical protein
MAHIRRKIEKNPQNPVHPDGNGTRLSDGENPTRLDCGALSQKRAILEQEALLLSDGRGEHGGTVDASAVRASG